MFPPPAVGSKRPYKGAKQKRGTTLTAIPLSLQTGPVGMRSHRPAEPLFLPVGNGDAHPTVGLMPHTGHPSNTTTAAMPTRYIADAEHYTDVLSKVAVVKRSLWIATADIKDLHVAGAADRAARTVPFLEVLAGLLNRGVEVRLMHA